MGFVHMIKTSMDTSCMNHTWFMQDNKNHAWTMRDYDHVWAMYDFKC